VNTPPAAPAHRTLWIGLGLAALALILLVPMAFGAGLALHLECSLTPVGSETIWTPGVVVNSPPNGTAIGWANGSVIGADSETVMLGNGSAAVLEVEMNWTVERTGMVWTAGPGLAGRCSQPYWVTAADSGVSSTPNSVWCVLQGPGNASDVGLSPSTPVPGCPFLGTDQAAKFNDTFATSCRNVSAYDAGCGSYTLEDAGGPRIATHTTVQGLLVEIPVPGQPVAPWLGAGDPANQTVIYTTWGSGCWIFESEDAPAGLSTGLLTWGPYGTLSGPKSNVCPFE
jgi:hypothetical protein